MKPEFTLIECGLWEWLYVDGTLMFKRKASGYTDMLFGTLLAMTLTNHDYCDLSGVPAITADDHDGYFWMTVDPPRKLEDIDYRINEFITHHEFVVELAS